MAARLGLSVSYLSQLENDARPLTAAVITALRRHHPAETAAIEGEAPARRMGALSDALTDPVLDAPLAPAPIAPLAIERPAVADLRNVPPPCPADADARPQMVETSLASRGGR